MKQKPDEKTDEKTDGKLDRKMVLLIVLAVAIIAAILFNLLVSDENNPQELADDSSLINSQENNQEEEETIVLETDIVEDGFVNGSTITAGEAQTIINNQEDIVILDVRDADEYAKGHIPGAVLLPVASLKREAENTFTDKEQLILVYCRSGRRSREAVNQLIELGYQNVLDFGGIIDWPYEVVQ